METNMIIPVNGLADGRNRFHRHAGKEFFVDFENSEIIDADIDVRIDVEKVRRDRVDVDCHIDGSVTVTCDRCLGNLVLPVNADAVLSLHLGSVGETEDGTYEEDGREIVNLPAADTDYDMAQIVYDYVCLSLPIQRFHPEGECDPEVAGRIGRTSAEIQGERTDNPFAALKGLFPDKETNEN